MTDETPATEVANPVPQENEVLRAARLARELRETVADKAAAVDWKTAAGIGVGSAALIAALLYARSGRK